MNAIQAFFYLLRCGLWGESFPLPSCFPLSGRQWGDVYNIARRQTVRGLVFQGICLLPDGVMPPDEELIRWAACIDNIEHRNRRMNGALVHLSQHFRQHGLHPVVMKGQGIACMYDEPLLRECGDIDLYFPHDSEREHAESLLHQAGIAIESHADGSTSYLWQGITVEHHPTLCDLHGTSVQRFLHEMEQQQGFQELSIVSQDGATTILVPSPRLHWVLLSSHILKHTLGRGIGMRQLCDLARFCSCQSFQPNESDLLQVCRMAGISRWTQLLQSCLVDYLGLSADHLPIASASTDASRLMDIILRGGNFGQHHHSHHSHHGPWRRKVQTATCFLSNMSFSLRYAPRQAAHTFIQLLNGQKL